MPTPDSVPPFNSEVFHKPTLFRAIQPLQDPIRTLDETFPHLPQLGFAVGLDAVGLEDDLTKDHLTQLFVFLVPHGRITGWGRDEALTLR